RQSARIGGTRPHLTTAETLLSERIDRAFGAIPVSSRDCEVSASTSSRPTALARSARTDIELLSEASMDSQASQISSVEQPWVPGTYPGRAASSGCIEAAC